MVQGRRITKHLPWVSNTSHVKLQRHKFNEEESKNELIKTQRATVGPVKKDINT